MKKLKSTAVIASVALVASVFTGCSKPTDNTGGGITGPVTKNFTEEDMELDSSKIINGWAYWTSSLDSFVGKEITIDFSCEMKVENSGDKDQKLMWQVNNNGSYPEVAAHTFSPSDKDFVTVKGKNTEPIKIASGALFYLSTYELDTDNLKISVKNIKYTITYEGGSEKPVEEKKFPTDIFTVGEANTCGLTVRDKMEAFTIFENGLASNVKTETDGSVTFTAGTNGGDGGTGGGVSFYVNSDKASHLRMSNYDSIEFELVYSPITGKWNPNAKIPNFAFILLPWDSSGIYGGTKVISYSNGDADYGTLKTSIKIDEKLIEDLKEDSDYDAIKGFAIKWNDWKSGNSKGDQLKVQVKSVKFVKKADAGVDENVNDNIPKGTVQQIYYPAHDWTVAGVSADKPADYDKHAWVYLPAGYDDPANKDKEYPLFVLMHGYNQNENTWGLSDQGNGGRIKGYMDRGMNAGNVEQFILVCPTGVASKSWGSGKGGNGAGNDQKGFDAFGGELRNDLIPYIRKNFRVKDGRDNVAMAGLSYGGKQTFDIGIYECLDLISYFGAYSGALISHSAEDFMKMVDGKWPNDAEHKIHQLYLICGTGDTMVYEYHQKYAPALEAWKGEGKRVENYLTEEVPGEGHNFPVWYKGFKHFIPLLFK